LKQKQYWRSLNVKDKTICVAGLENYDIQEKWFWDLLFEKLFRNLKASENNFILDVCCGNGRCVSKYAPYFQNVGLTDNNSYFIRAAENTCKDLDLKTVFISEVNLSVLLFPKKIKWDLILCNFALLNLNHEDLAHFITKCKDALKIGGHIVIKETFARKTDEKYGENLDMFGGILYRTPSTIKSLFD